VAPIVVLTYTAERCAALGRPGEQRQIYAAGGRVGKRNRNSKQSRADTSEKYIIVLEKPVLDVLASVGRP